MKHPATKWKQWLPGIIGLFILLAIFFSPHCLSAERRKYYSLNNTPDHDFPYVNCSLRAMDADIRDVLQAFADRYNLNIIMSQEVKGAISIIINDIPVKEAFLNILRYSDLGYTKEENVYRIKPIESLLKEETLRQKTESLTTKIIPLKYANAERLLKNLSKFKSKAPEAVIDADKWTNSVIVKDTAKNIREITNIIRQLDVSSPAQEIKELEKATKIIDLHYINCEDVAGIKTLQGKISTHPQTNSVIITDAPQNIPHLVSIIQELDKPISQILIEAKIVETSKSFSRSLGIQWGGHYSVSPSSGKNFPTVSVGGALGGSSYSDTPANYAVNLPGTGTAYGSLDFLVGHLKDKVALNIRLSAMEDNGNGRIISQPRIITLDNKEAVISHGETIQLPTGTSATTTVVTGGEAQSMETEEKEAKTELIVMPHIISGNQIKLTINLKRDTPDYGRVINEVPVINTREAKTELIISDGETTVIGGLAVTDISNLDRSIPWLSRIPVLGWLFKSKSKQSSHGELLVFITPHIIQTSDSVRTEN